MRKTVFEFKSYKPFLIYETENSTSRRGQKSLLAKALQCQSAYLSQVLNGKAELSFEQAYRACDFFRLGHEEQDYFMLLVQKDRAGIQDLRIYYQKQIDQLLERRLNLKKRLGQENLLSEKEKTIYYSSWIYPAIHMAVTIKHLQNKERLQKFFQLPQKQMNTVIDFLLKTGLIQQVGSELHAGISVIHLGNDSQSIYKHHTNWRLQAIESLEREDIYDVHYSAVVTLSKADIKKIKNLLLEQLKENIEIIKASNEEELCVLNIDFFNLKKTIEN